MKRSTLVFFFALVVIVAAIARCNSRSRLADERDQTTVPASPLLPSASPSPMTTAPPAASASVSPVATPEASRSATVDMATLASRIQPSVVSISVFEPSGKLLRTGTGIFVSNDGRVVTTRSLMEGAAHAIAKTTDNRIHNVNGILIDAAADDLAVLKLDVKDRVPSVLPNTVAAIEKGARIAVVESPLGRSKTPLVEGTISKVHRGGNGEWMELSAPVTGDGMGAPVINENGDVIGLVTRGSADPAVVVRPSATLIAVLGRAPTDGKGGKWFVEETPSAPGEGPLQKIPLAQSPPGQQPKLIYNPPPAYPVSAGRTAGPLRGSGKFRLSFDASGHVRNIAILKSTQNNALDQAAIDALRRWKATPGQEWTVNVPITFQ